ncbi:MAG TPA: hypothetical protein EYP56_02905 [Planctomycetaceae bacterium]|nr:hypothetical protein [Planctomycetaceae bacterium]HIQ20000.1 hypothetical protein [Planctomycetota bacterium]
MKRWWTLLLGAFLLAGCGPAVSEEELGEVIHEVPEIAGADEPFPIPQIEAPSDEQQGTPEEDEGRHEPEEWDDVG